MVILYLALNQYYKLFFSRAVVNAVFADDISNRLFKLVNLDELLAFKLLTLVPNWVSVVLLNDVLDVSSIKI